MTTTDALDDLAQKIGETCFTLAADWGWSDRTLHMGCEQHDINPKAAKAIFPRGCLDVINQFAQRADQDTFNHLQATDMSDVKIRDRIKTGVLMRLDHDLPHADAVRRAMGRLLLPDACGLGPAMLARTADHIWRGIGDPSLDENYYSKRAILSGIWTQVLTTALSDGRDEAERILDARIENVMQFETFKRKLPTFDLDDLFAKLGAARYR